MTEVPQYKRVCYYQKWSEADGLSPDKINTSLCTHYIFGFSWINDEGLMVMEEPDDEIRYQQLLEMKDRAPDIKIMLSLGSSLGDLKLSNAVSNNERRTRLVNSIVIFLNKYSFDGLDIDWEFPAWMPSGAPLKDRNNFILLLKDLRQRFDENSKPLLLSVAVGTPYTIVIMSYKIREMNQYVDFVNLMTYGTHNYEWYYPVTGHNSPLFRRRGELLLFATMNTVWAVDYWLKHGMDKSKVLVGLGAYGNGYVLRNPNHHGVGALAKSGHEASDYPEICKMLADGATRVFDDEAKVPYLYKDNLWVSYDDEESFTIKCNWVKQQQLGGVMTWKLNHDDWNGTCGGKQFPLHSVIYDILG